MNDPTLPISAAIAPQAIAGAPDLSTQLSDLAQQSAQINERLQALAKQIPAVATPASRLDIFHGYMGIFVVSFLVALLITPLLRRLAISQGIVDRPSEARKIHRVPIAYLGGVAVYIGILAGILFAYTAPLHNLISFHESTKTDHSGLPGGVPLSVLIGMTVIMLAGLWDDVVGTYPRLKIAWMLIAAGALATEDVGVKVAAGVLVPIAKALGIHTVIQNLAAGGTVETVAFHIPLPMSVLGYTNINVDIVYWIGTAIIAVFVLGACNASNLIDGLDGLLTGVTTIANAGLLVIALGLAALDDGPRDASRIVLGLAVLGACLGFLPHNFNPATIFLGDAGSLMLGYCTIVLVLMLGDTGKTHLVMAGLIIYAIPIIDTTLAIVRRKMSGRKISDADDHHLHHMLKRALGVKGAVFVLYGIGIGFASLGILLSEGRQRVVYALVCVFAAFIGVIALKIGRKELMERQMLEAESRRNRDADPKGPSEPAAKSTDPAKIPYQA